MFDKAVRDLTLKYTLLFFGVIWLISAGVYGYMRISFGGDYSQSGRVVRELAKQEGNIEQVRATVSAADAAFERLAVGLAGINLLLLVAVPPISHYLARQTLGPIRRSYQTQQQFAANASHELRTPLSVIAAEIDLALRKDRSAKTYQKVLGTLRYEAGRLSELIANLLLLARGDQAQLRDRFGRLDPSVPLSAALKKLKPAARRRRVKLTLIQPSAALFVQGDPLLLERLLFNLIDNAVKFSASGGEVKISWRRRGGRRLIIDVADTGPGMDQATKSSATAQFWRGDASRTSGGHGLGLAIADNIVKLHGGRLSFHDNHPSGLIVRINLPLA